MTALGKAPLDALLATLFTVNTSGNIEADAVLARLRDILDSYGNTTGLVNNQIPIKSNQDGVLMPSVLTQETDHVHSAMALSGPGNATLNIGPITAVSEGSTVSFFDRSRNLMFGAVVHDTTAGAVASRTAFYFKPVDNFALTDAAANLSDTFTGTTHQFAIVNANLGTAKEYRAITRSAGSTEITGANLTIRRNSHTDPHPVFDYKRDVSGGAGFTLAGGAAQTETTIDLVREHLFLAGETLYVTIEGDGATQLNLMGQTISGQEVPHVDVWGRLGVIQGIEDALGVPAQDGYVLSSTVAGVRSWVPLGAAAVVPSIHNLSVDIASRVTVGTDLNGPHTVTFDVSNHSTLTAMELVVTAGDNVQLTLPVRDGQQSQTVTLANIVTSSPTTVTFQLQGTYAGGTVSSNVYTVNVVAAAGTHEQGYYGVRPSNDFATVALDQLTAVDVTQSGTVFDITFSLTSPGTAGILLPSNREIVTITNPNAPDPTRNILSDFDAQTQARTESGQDFTLYTEVNQSGFAGTLTVRVTTE